MGSCTSTSKRFSHKQTQQSRRKYSVYFPSETAGVQKYSERECKQHGIDFKDIQTIFAQSSAIVIPEGNFNVNANSKTTNELPQNIDPTSQVMIPQTLKEGEHFTIPLQRGESEEVPSGNKQKNPFEAFDYNEHPSVALEV